MLLLKASSSMWSQFMCFDQKCCFFQQLVLFLDNLKELVLVGHWNAFLDPKINRVRLSTRGSDKCESSLINLIAQLNLVDRFHLDYQGRELWTWLESLPSVHTKFYVDRVLEELTLNSLYVPHSTG